MEAMDCGGLKSIQDHPLGGKGAQATVSRAIRAAVVDDDDLLTGAERALEARVGGRQRVVLVGCRHARRDRRVGDGSIQGCEGLEGLLEGCRIRGARGDRRRRRSRSRRRCRRRGLRLQCRRDLPLQ